MSASGPSGPLVYPSRRTFKSKLWSRSSVVDSSVVSTLASGARGPRFDPHWLGGKFHCPNTLSFVSFAGMTLDKCAVLQIRM